MRKTKLSLDDIVLIALYADFLDTTIPPLTNSQYNRLEYKLANSKLKSPSGLLECPLDEMKIQLVLDDAEVALISQRLTLIPKVISKLSQYEKLEIGLLTKYDDDYPSVLFERLKKNAPLILFYCGNLNLLKQAAISVIGPTQPNDIMIENTIKVTNKVSSEGFNLMTSGNNGCESISIKQQLNNGGQVVLFASSDLLKKKLEYLRFVSNRQMLIVSHRHPYSENEIVESVIRNSFIYALCQTNFIIHSELNMGSLWFSAIQNLKHRWSKILAIVDDDFYGNAKLVEQGAIPVTMAKIEGNTTIEEMMDYTKKEISNLDEARQVSIFDLLGEQSE